MVKNKNKTTNLQRFYMVIVGILTLSVLGVGVPTVHAEEPIENVLKQVTEEVQSLESKEESARKFVTGKSLEELEVIRDTLRDKEELTENEEIILDMVRSYIKGYHEEYLLIGGAVIFLLILGGHYIADKNGMIDDRVIW